ncbi:NDC1 [Candida pseudojiufengensis]|uniref:NDC1 n=1 Tax=Candida pseudojiufengensis TaxID=497109 RepID=UPI0022244239|nr:NDC1 [Candida pseudojiufengensis]KAI5962932.1 NDC1 [Candida pseudojiufengensis]
MSSSNSSIENDKYEYYRIFNKVYNKRLKFILNINILLSIFMALILNLPFNHKYKLFTIFLKLPIYFISLTLIRQVRKKFSTVEFSTHKTLGSQIYHSIFSQNFIHISLFYIISATLVYSIFIFNLPFTFDFYIISKEYRKNPLLNDEWIYYWTCPFTIGLYYSANQLIFQRNRLNFKIGHNRNNPQSNLFKHIPNCIGNAIGLSLIFVLVNPVIYLIFKRYLYKALFILSIFGLDTSVPPHNVSLLTYLKLSFLAYIIILNWEFENHVFEVYSTIGCLDGQKPISSYSKDPLNCLLNGLKDVSPKHQLSRLTAFQELAYISNTSQKEGLKLRLAIFTVRSKKEKIWPALFNECSLVIREIGDRINYRSSSDMRILKDVQDSLVRDIDTGFKPKQSTNLFGNSFTSTSDKTESKPKPTVANEPTPSNNKLVNYWNYEIVAPIKKLIAHYNPKFSPNLKINIKKIQNLIFQTKRQFLDTKFGILFRITLKRDCESRIRNPTNYGNAIISISNLLRQSQLEDSLNIITSEDLSTSLNLFEKSIRISTNYIDYIPASVFINTSNPQYCLISKLRNLAMFEFNEIVLSFDSQLNDLILNQKTYKLAKWCINKAIADRQTKEKSNYRF